MNPDTNKNSSSSPQSSPRPNLPDPKTVLQDAQLTREEKIAKLERWRQDAEEIETANDEGMGGVVRPSNLAAVLAALRELEERESSGESAAEDS